MDNFQKFVNAFAMLKARFDRDGLDSINIHHKISRSKFYKIVGIDDEDKARQYEYQKKVEMDNKIEMAFGMVNQYGSVYEIDETVRRYILLNEPPQDKELLKRLSLPFKAIFIETEITQNDFDIGVNNISGILLVEATNLNTDDNKVTGRTFFVYYLCEEYENNTRSVYIDQFLIDFENPNIFYDDKKTLRFLKKFIANTLLFFNDKEVEWVEHIRGEKNRQRRIKDGKMPLPDSHTVRLTGSLKKYIDGVVSVGGFGGRYHYKFWVSGHYRHLTSDKYTDMKGKWIKIEPYQKGQGFAVERHYELKFAKDDDRKKEMQSENIFYDDIKPLDKPLREMRK